MTEDLDDWLAKWKKIIDKISELVSAEGKEMGLFDVEAGKDIKKQFENYQVTCETVKGIFEVVVTTSLPGEERIFWPFFIKKVFERFI